MDKIEYEIPNTQVTPQGLWKYTQPESGKEFTHYDYVAQIKQIREHRKGNGYVIPDGFEKQINDDMCRQNPHWIGEGKTCRRLLHPIVRAIVHPLSWKEVMAFLNMLLHWKKDGSEFVSQEEADRRASICAQCPLNVSVHYNCGPCTQLVEKSVGKLIGEKKTPFDEELKACGICKCQNRVQVWFPEKALESTITDDMRAKFEMADWCWKGKLS